ncbi:hypothetical protein C7999DRAFT_17956 [Corynascus novoguineensis]|uniref:Gamma-butyrobetaine dioxygenase n=1 Tax=Corynascus novoguineensis TaxID=1126955 RepID=A0AAN7CME6_9PEZI|nr:hypothetical protein C7999DRAFT_17956 [Corynascus novoguineensis]
MERTLRLARPAGLLAARCTPVLPTRGTSLRLWQQSNAPTSILRTTLQHGRLGAIRSNQTDSQGGLQEDAGASTQTTSEDTVPGVKHSKKRSAWDRQRKAKKEQFKRMKNEAGVVEFNSEKLKFRWWDSSWNRDLVLSPLWLRDSCPCHVCVDPDSGQKSFSTTDLPDKPLIESAQVTNDRTLEIVWADDGPSGGASHKTVFPAEEIREWMEDSRWQRGRLAPRVPERIMWDKAEYEALLAKGRCRVSYKDWMSDEPAFLAAFADLRQTGLITITDVPSDECEVERVANRIGSVQETFYGRTWDVRAKPQAENVAYTDKFLGLHQDLMYHDPVPGLQVLHCLSNSCEGGESLFSHGVRAAYELRLQNPDAYEKLCKFHVWFHYHKGDKHFFRARETIKPGPTGLPREVRWAPPFQATFRMAAGEKYGRVLAEWKRAAAAFQASVEDPHNMVQFKLKEGECVIFDNRTVLHGRQQFKTGSGGSRWLKGTYISYQNYIATATRLTEQMKAHGVPLTPEHNMWHEEEKVKQSLQLRGRALSGQDSSGATAGPATSTAESANAA